MKLTTLSDQSLQHSLVALVGRERCLVVTFLEHLAEFERRQLFIPLGLASLFDYLTRYLRLPNGSAYRRMVCARLLARFPEAGGRLRDGRLSLASLARLKDALTGENAQELLERASGRTEQEVEELACAYLPRPVPQRDVLRRQPAAAAAPELPLPAGSGAPAEKVEPLTEDRFRWHLSFGRAVRDKLERARALLSHQVPDGDGEAILDRALDALLEKLERRKGLVARPRKAEPPTPRPSSIWAVRSCSFRGRARRSAARPSRARGPRALTSRGERGSIHDAWRGHSMTGAKNRRLSCHRRPDGSAGRAGAKAPPRGRRRTVSQGARRRAEQARHRKRGLDTHRASLPRPT